MQVWCVVYLLTLKQCTGINTLDTTQPVHLGELHGSDEPNPKYRIQIQGPVSSQPGEASSSEPESSYPQSFIRSKSSFPNLSSSQNNPNKSPSQTFFYDNSNPNSIQSIPNSIPNSSVSQTTFLNIPNPLIFQNSSSTISSQLPTSSEHESEDILETEEFISVPPGSPGTDLSEDDNLNSGTDLPSDEDIQLTTLATDLEIILDTVFTNSSYSGSQETQRRGGYNSLRSRENQGKVISLETILARLEEKEEKDENINSGLDREHSTILNPQVKEISKFENFPLIKTRKQFLKENVPKKVEVQRKYVFNPKDPSTLATPGNHQKKNLFNQSIKENNQPEIRRNQSAVNPYQSSARQNQLRRNNDQIFYQKKYRKQFENENTSHNPDFSETSSEPGIKSETELSGQDELSSPGAQIHTENLGPQPNPHTKEGLGEPRIRTHSAQGARTDTVRRRTEIKEPNLQYTKTEDLNSERKDILPNLGLNPVLREETFTQRRENSNPETGAGLNQDGAIAESLEDWKEREEHVFKPEVKEPEKETFQRPEISSAEETLRLVNEQQANNPEDRGERLPRKIASFSKSNIRNNPPKLDGKYDFSFTSEDGSSRQETGSMGPGDSIGMQGSYSYLSPEGEVISVSYTADDTGFHPSGSHFPVAPPLPPHVQRLLDHLKKVNS